MTTKTKRLNKDLCARIKSAAMRDIFKVRLEALIEREKNLGEGVYSVGVPKEHRELMAKLPSNYFGWVDCISVNDESGNPIYHPMRSAVGSDAHMLHMLIMGHGSRHNDYRLQLRNQKIAPRWIVHGGSVVPGQALLVQISAWRGEYIALIKEALDLARKIDSVLAATRTIKALLDTWPECKSYLPEDAFSADDRSMPMVLIADLNDAIKKAKCAPGTSSSTSDDMAAAVINELIKEAT